MTKKKIAVLGGGSWGSVLSNLASLNGSEVVLWMRDKKVVNFINEKKENRKYLPGYKLDKSLIASSDLSVINSANLVLFCVPSDAFREVVLKSRDFISSEAHLVSATKGVEEEGFSLMSDILETNSQEGQNVGVISGPNLAKEISLGQLTGTVIASKNKKLRNDVVEIFSSNFFKVYTSEDPYGVELGGTLKNIYAIACGIADGLNSGENTIGMIMTRGLAEMSRFAVSQGADPMTFLGLSGVGDLITTCASPLSRNHTFGKLIGVGFSVDVAKTKIGQATEGIKTLRAVWKKAKEESIPMPIVDSLYEIIYENKPLNNSVEKVLGRDQLKDVEFSR